MQKYLKNNITIAIAVFASCAMLTTIYYLKGLVLPNALSFIGNTSIMALTILGTVLCNGLFLLATDALFFRDEKFKNRFFYVTKALWISQLLLLPVSFILLLANLFVNLDISIINNAVVVSISFLSQLILFFSYKFVTNHDWSETIKVVSSQIMLALFLSVLLRFV